MMQNIIGTSYKPYVHKVIYYLLQQSLLVIFFPPEFENVRHYYSNDFLVSKETVVLRPWERSKQKFGFIKRVDKG